jgi:hypothetical protein
MQPPAVRATPAPAQGRELSLGQEALWFLQKLNPACAAYNVTGALTLHFPVDEALLEAAVRRTLRRHGQLHAVFQSDDGDLRRFPADPAPGILQVHQASDLGDDALRRLVHDLALRPFELDRTAPVRVDLLRRDGGESVLLVVLHHIAADDISQLLLLREFIAEYAAVAPEAARADPDGFDEYVRRERELLASPRSAAAQAHWRGELEPVPAPLDPPTRQPRPAVYRFEGAQIEMELAPDLTAGVQREAAARDVTAFTYLFTVFQALLYGFSGQAEFIVGYPVTQRSGRHYRASVGHFVNILPMCVRLDPAGSFDTALRRTNEKLWRGLKYRDYPFALMPRLVRTDRDPSRPGLISAMFVMNGKGVDDPFFAAIVPGRQVDYAGVRISRFDVPQQHGQSDITLEMIQHESTVYAKLKYNTSLYSQETAAGLAGEYLRLLTAAVDGTLPRTLDGIRAESTSLAGSRSEG